MKQADPWHRCTPGSCWAVLAAAAVMLLPGGPAALGDDAAASAPAQQQEPKEKAAAAGKDGAASPESKEPGSGNFLVVPITTELQRVHGKKQDNTKAYVFINGMAAVKEDDTVLHAGVIDFCGLWQSLEPYATGEPGGVVFQVWSRKWETGPPKGGSAASVLSLALQYAARELGLPDVRVHLIFVDPTWKYMDKWDRLVADLTTPPSEEAIQAESGIGDDQVRLYPVRTPLSRFLYDDADCVIHILPPVEEAGAGILITMQRCLPQLNLERKHKVCFLFHWKKSGLEVDRLAEEFCGEHVWKNLLGFETDVRVVWD